MLSLADALVMSSRLVALSVALQTLELLALHRAFAADGPLVRDPRATGIAAWLGSATSVVSLLVAQLALCLTVLMLGPSSLLLLVFASYIALIARLGGPFNGGSDALSALSLLMLGIAAATGGEGLLTKAALGYLGVQTLLSYFVAGVAKLKEPGWRSGRALAHFARLRKYGVPVRAQQLVQNPVLAFVASWLILLFECSFPLAMLEPALCLVYLGVGAGFHLANAALFGLNRFFFSWIAVYPVLLALSGLFRS